MFYETNYILLREKQCWLQAYKTKLQTNWNFMDENTTKIILAIIALMASTVGGITLYSKSKNIKYNINQKDIDINGNNNKVVGGDDKSGK